MDLHILPGVKSKEVAEAHLKDMHIQDDHSCTCMTYWIDEKRGNVFCLIEAPDKEAVIKLHHNAHGLIPNKIIEVNDVLVESFLGRITDPDDKVVDKDGLAVFYDPSFRILVILKTIDTIILQNDLGLDTAYALIRKLNSTIISAIKNNTGSEAENSGDEIIISFTSASKAVSFAKELLDKISTDEWNKLGLKATLTAGEPVTKNDRLFGDAILLGQRMYAVDDNQKIIISQAVKELLPLRHFENNSNIKVLSQNEEAFLTALFETMESNWQDDHFNGEDFCRKMAMSQSQLYRITTALTGHSPNTLLSDFKLEKAKELLKKKQLNISQITFESGFSSPSYFTKCFKKKYGILPLAYADSLQ